MKDYKYIGKLCREYRMIHLQATLKDIEGNENIKSLSSFEHGRSSNINHVIKYVEYCETKEEILWFILREGVWEDGVNPRTKIIYINV